MAKIATFFEVPTESTKVHGDVECGSRVFSANGALYLQLDTYGSNERAIPGKVSQSIQLDRDGAEALAAILERAFPGVSRAR